MKKIVTKYQVQLVKESSKKYEIMDKKLSCPEVAYNFIRSVFSNLESSPQEKFIVVALNTANDCVGVFEVTTGTMNASIVNPRDVFQRLLLVNAYTFICAHNHPSGHCNPSKTDIEATKRLAECGQIMGIELLDHLIIGDNCYFSFKEKGYI